MGGAGAKLHIFLHFLNFLQIPTSNEQEPKITVKAMLSGSSSEYGETMYAMNKVI